MIGETIDNSLYKYVKSAQVHGTENNPSDVNNEKRDAQSYPSTNIIMLYIISDTNNDTLDNPRAAKFMHDPSDQNPQLDKGTEGDIWRCKPARLQEYATPRNYLTLYSIIEILQAIAFAFRLFGPTLGFLMSSAFLKIHENPFEDPGYGPEDPRWIGGWWMGFLVQGVVLLVVTIPMTFFPRRLPNERPLPESKSSAGETCAQMLKGMVPALKRLYRNPLFVVLCCNQVMSILGSFGHYVMLPKYMEYQFRLTASDASLYSGPPGLIAIQVSTVIGGYGIWKLRPRAKFLIAVQIMSELVVAVGFLILMIPSCEKVDLSNVGLAVDGTLNLDNQCNADCHCSTSAFTPICGLDARTTYFSPCHAGCTEIRNGTKPQFFHNCSCVVDNSEAFVIAKALEKGYCIDQNCWSQALAYIIILPVIHGVTGLLKVAHTMVFLRSVEPQDKSVALGTFQMISCLFGFVPYPLLFGALVDSACLVWEKSCGRTGNCWFYDVDKFNYMLHGVSAAFSLLSALGLVVVYFLRDRLRDFYEDDEPAEGIASPDNEKEMIKSGGDSSVDAVSKL